MAVYKYQLLAASKPTILDNIGDLLMLIANTLITIDPNFSIVISGYYAPTNTWRVSLAYKNYVYKLYLYSSSNNTMGIQIDNFSSTSVTVYIRPNEYTNPSNDAVTHPGGVGCVLEVYTNATDIFVQIRPYSAYSDDCSAIGTVHGYFSVYDMVTKANVMHAGILNSTQVLLFEAEVGQPTLTGGLVCAYPANTFLTVNNGYAILSRMYGLPDSVLNEHPAQTPLNIFRLLSFNSLVPTDHTINIGADKFLTVGKNIAVKIS